MNTMMNSTSKKLTAISTNIFINPCFYFSNNSIKKIKKKSAFNLVETEDVLFACKLSDGETLQNYKTNAQS